MPLINPAVIQWIGQMDDSDQVVAYYAYQSLQEEVFKAGGPKVEEEARTELVKVLGEALVARAKPGQGAGGRGAASFASNVFLTSVAAKRTEPLYPARVRNNLARLLGYLPDNAAVPHLATAMGDLEVRDTARQSLENHSAEAATEALITALNSTGPAFCVGVINSLAKRKSPPVNAALKKAAGDQQSEVRIAALQALADHPQPDNDAVIEKSTRAASPKERLIAHQARARLAETLRASGNKQAAERTYKAILASEAPEPQKQACRLALGM